MIPRLLGGRYEITRLLRGGPVTDTYEGFDQQQRRPVVIEVLHTGLSNDLTSVALFTNGFEAAARLVHPGIVPVSRATVVRDVHFAVREAVEGPALAEFLSQHGPPRPMRAAVIAAAIGEVLDYAHGQKVVHGGLSPSHVLLASDGEVKVSGFGLNADLVSDVDPHYAAPERVDNANADARSDLYALGCCLYEMLLGRPPFDGETTLAIQQQHAEAEPWFPEEPDPEAPIPPELIAITRRLLAKQPDDRYLSADDLVKDLTDLLATDDSEAAAPDEPGPEPVAVTAAVPGATAPPEPGPPGPEMEVGPPPGDPRLDPTVHEAPEVQPPGLSLPKDLEDLYVPSELRVYDEVPEDPYEELVNAKPFKRTAALLAAAVLVPFAVGGVIATQWVGGSSADTDGTRTAPLAGIQTTTTATSLEATTTTEDPTTTKPAAETTTTTTTTTTQPEPSTTGATTTTRPSTTGTTRPSTTASTAPPTRTVPYVVGSSESGARGTLSNAGFQVSVQRQPSQRSQRGRVISQSPWAGQSRPAGSTVTITVGCGGFGPNRC